MFYGDLHFIDILIFAGVAAFLFYRLKGILGKKTGFEKRPSNEDVTGPLDEEKKINESLELEKKFKELEKAYQKIPNFNHTLFLQGAKNAFESIVAMFYEENKNGLKKLVSKKVYKNFCNTIDSEEIKMKPKQILSLKIESIKKVWTEDEKIFITVSYISKQIDLNGDNETTKKDLWTFEKLISDKDPMWLLSST